MFFEQEKPKCPVLELVALEEASAPYELDESSSCGPEEMASYRCKLRMNLLTLLGGRD